MTDLILILLVLIETFCFGYFHSNFQNWDRPNNWKYFLLGILFLAILRNVYGFFRSFF